MNTGTGTPRGRARRRGANRFGPAVVGSLVAKAVEMVTLVLLATLVPRSLGPADFGSFSVLLTLVTLGSLALTLGGPTVMVRFVPAAPEAERIALARAIGARLARGRAVQVAAITIGVGALVAVDASRFPLVNATLLLAALAVNVATSLALQMTLGLGRTAAWSARFPLQNAVLIVGVLALTPQLGETGASVAILLSALSGAVLAAISIVPVLSGSHPRVDIPDGAIRFGALQATAAALTQFTQRGGVLIVALLAGSSVQTGFAALATGIALGVTYAILQTFTVAMPHLDHDDERAGRWAEGASIVGPHPGEAALQRLALLLVAFALPAALLGALLSGPLVPAVFGEEYAGAAVAFGPALALMVFAPLGALLVQASALRLRPDVAVRSAAATAAVFVSVALAAVPAWGAAGGLTAALAGSAVGCIAGMQALPRAVTPRLFVLTYVGAGAVVALAAIS